MELGTKEEKKYPNPRELGKEIRIGSASSGTKEVARSSFHIESAYEIRTGATLGS